MTFEHEMSQLSTAEPQMKTQPNNAHNARCALLTEEVFYPTDFSKAQSSKPPQQAVMCFVLVFVF